MQQSLRWDHDYLRSLYLVSELEDFLNDDDQQYTSLSEEEFLGLGVQGTFRYIGQYDEYKYGVSSSASNTDYYVRQALKKFDPEQYRRIIGYTRRAVYGKALTRLLHSARPVHTMENLRNDPIALSCYEEAKLEADSFLFGLQERFSPLNNLQDAALALPTATSAGLSFPGKKKGEVMQQAINKAEYMWRKITKPGSSLLSRVRRPPCQIAIRGHLSPVDKIKSRCVIVYPYEVQLLEAKLYKPLYARMKEVSPIITGKGSLYRLYKYLQSNPDRHFVNLDISGWDRMRAIFLIRDCFKILKNRLYLDDDHLTVHKWLSDYYVDTPIALSSGHLFIQHGGVPSGTFLTLIMNSLMNYVIQKTVLKYLGLTVLDFSIVGDDCAFFVDPEDNFMIRWLPLFVRYNQYFFSCRINQEKSVITTDVHDRTFIGYRWVNFRLFRPTDEFFASALYPERDVKNVAVSFSRVFSYLCIGGINDEKFYSFFEFFISVYAEHLRAYGRKMFQPTVFRFGSLRVFKDVLNFREEEIMHLEFDEFLSRINWQAVPYMFTLGISIRKE